LEILDSLTATSEVVLASLGGRPVMREEMGVREEEGGEGAVSSEERGGSETDEKGGSGSGNGSFKGEEELRQRPRPREVPDGIGEAMGGSGEGKAARDV